MILQLPVLIWLLQRQPQHKSNKQRVMEQTLFNGCEKYSGTDLLSDFETGVTLSSCVMSTRCSFFLYRLQVLFATCLLKQQLLPMQLIYNKVKSTLRTIVHSRFANGRCVHATLLAHFRLNDVSLRREVASNIIINPKM